jgi:predicted nucleic acid-binding protein
LVDSSVWIGFLRGDELPAVTVLVRSLEQGLGIWIAPPVLQEVLQGADNADRYARWDRVLGELPLLESTNQRATARAAAQLYARCRWAGITPRSANDCLIATIAIEHATPLLHADQDFPRIARIEPQLKLLP